MELDFPFHIDGRGRTATTGRNDHVRDLIEQVLFTAPGERANRPTFGTGLLQLVFAPGGDELATATQFLVQGALQQWLGEVISVQGVEVHAEESTLRVTVQYVARGEPQQRSAEFTREI